MALYSSIIDMIGNTPMVELRSLAPRPDVHIYAKLEGQNPTGSVKDRIAKYMIEAGENVGRTASPAPRSSSRPPATPGIGLAMIGQVKGYKVVCVMPESVSEERTVLLTAFGAEIIYTPGDLGSNGSIAHAEGDRGGEPRQVLLPVPVRQRSEPARPLRDHRARDPARPAADHRLRGRASAPAARSPAPAAT